jgi:hypothetical protein
MDDAGAPGASRCGSKALHKYDMLTVRLRHQSRVFEMAEVKTGPRGTVILPCSRGLKEEVQDNEIE